MAHKIDPIKYDALDFISNVFHDKVAVVYGDVMMRKWALSQSMWVSLFHDSFLFAFQHAKMRSQMNGAVSTWCSIVGDSHGLACLAVLDCGWCVRSTTRPSTSDLRTCLCVCVHNGKWHSLTVNGSLVNDRECSFVEHILFSSSSGGMRKCRRMCASSSGECAYRSQSTPEFWLYTVWVVVVSIDLMSHTHMFAPPADKNDNECF